MVLEALGLLIATVIVVAGSAKTLWWLVKAQPRKTVLKGAGAGVLLTISALVLTNALPTLWELIRK